MVGNPILVPTNAANPNRLSDSASTNKELIDFTMKERGSLSTTSKTKTTGGSFIREAISNRELPQEIEEVITDSWRTSTRSRYESVLKRWKCYAISRNENSCITNIDSVLRFLHAMYNDGCLYSGLCATPSALTSVVTINGFVKLSDHPLLVRYLKGIFNRHPPLPRYMHIWDINLVLTYYNRIDHNEDLEFEYLVKKIVMLFIILRARGKHALSTIYVENIVFKDDKVILLPNKTVKHSKPTRPLQPLIYNAYRENIKLCLVNCLLSYLERRKLLVNDDVKELVISYGKPHRPVGSDALSRWIKDELKLSGIDMIMKKGCWKSESTFKYFYDKDIINNDSDKLNYESVII